MAAAIAGRTVGPAGAVTAIVDATIAARRADTDTIRMRSTVLAGPDTAGREAPDIVGQGTVGPDIEEASTRVAIAATADRRDAMAMPAVRFRIATRIIRRLLNS